MTSTGNQAIGAGILTPEMQEILDHTDHQEDHGDTQANNGQDAEESQRIIIRIPEDGRQRSELLHDPVTDGSKYRKNSGKQSICQCKHLTKIF